LIEVGDRDVADIKVGLPPLIVGRVDIDDGTALPTLRAVFAPGAELPSQVSILAKLNKESLTHGWYARTDGWFATPAQAGQYTVAVSLPFGYRVKSKRQGSEDLTRGPLIVTETNATPVRITLTRTPHSDALPTFTVAGRIDGAAAVPAEPLRLSGASRARDGLNSIFGIAAENRMGEVSVQADGSFEFHGVPPGFYELTGSGLQPMTVVVTASDVRGIELGPSLPVRLQQVLSSPPSPAGGAARLKVSGKVTNLPANRELMSLPGPRILLGARLQTSMRDDGSFEFNNVAPGTYSLGWTGIQIPGGATGAMGSHTKVVVADRDVTGVTLELPFGISVFARVALKGDSDPSVPGVDKLYWAYRPIMSGGEVLADSSSGGIISFGVYAIIPRVPERYRLISLTADGVDVLKTGLWLDGSSNAVELLFTLEPVP
jgi:hypothetical protein